MYFKIIKDLWPLLLGLMMIMTGIGLQGTLLSVRAELEGFDTFTIGILMSLYYFGYLGGYFVAPKLIADVGHIRVFAAFASLMSVIILMHGLFINPFIWGASRLLTGFCYAALLIVIESWFNNKATNENRGSLLSSYVGVCYFGMILGQILMNIEDPSQIGLFVLTSVIISLALLPLSLSTRKAPELDNVEPISLKTLFGYSPLGVIGIFINGITGGTTLVLGALYAVSEGLSIPQTSIFMGSMLAGGIFFSTIIGRLSDQFGRRPMLIISSIVAAMAAMAMFICDVDNFELLLVAAFIFSGINFNIYGLSMAHTNDFLKPSQMVSAGAALILVNGMGACLGPVFVSLLMDIYGTDIMFLVLGWICLIPAVFGIYRKTQRDTITVAQQEDYVPVPLRTSSVILEDVKEYQQDNN